MVLTLGKPKTKPKIKLPRLILGGCPRCMGGNGHGDLYINEDGNYHCLQCGYVKWERIWTKTYKI